MVKSSGLRGRGGAGSHRHKVVIHDNKSWPHYVVANADESEPGTFKDREIMESNPFQFLEGVALAAYAVGANTAYVYLRGEVQARCGSARIARSPRWRMRVTWARGCAGRSTA